MLESAVSCFDIPDGIVYLNTAGSAPRLHAVSAAADQAVRGGTHAWAQTTREWLGESERLRDTAASLFLTNPDALAIIPSVSYGLAIAARNLPLRAHQNVVVLANEYPSNRAIWQHEAQRSGALVTLLSRGPGQSWTDAVIASINAETAVVCVPTCHWIDGTLTDLCAISTAAHAHGSALVVDASQSLGAMPLDFAAIRPDFVVSAGHKWLLGPYGLAWLWASERWRDGGVPIEQTWLAREGREEFGAAGSDVLPYRDGARRFDAGGSANPLLVPMAYAALCQLQQWRVELIGQHLGALNQHLASGLAQRGAGDWVIPSHAPHLCAIKPPGAALQQFAERLKKAGIVAALRGNAIRISPHLHISREQMDRLAKIIAAPN